MTCDRRVNRPNQLEDSNAAKHSAFVNLFGGTDVATLRMKVCAELNDPLPTHCLQR